MQESYKKLITVQNGGMLAVKCCCDFIKIAWNLIHKH